MSNLMREEFEAACEARFNWALQDPYRDESERTLSTWDGESYRNRIVQGMWWAWQASRECLVIELPEEDDNGKIRWTAAMRSIESTGAKVKP